MQDILHFSGHIYLFIYLFNREMIKKFVLLNIEHEIPAGNIEFCSDEEGEAREQHGSA